MMFAFLFAMAQVIWPATSSAADEAAFQSSADPSATSDLSQTQIAADAAPAAAGSSAAPVVKVVPATLMDRAMSLLGVPFLILVAWAMSSNRRAINWRLVTWGVALQFVFGLIVLSPVATRFFFEVVDQGVKKLLFFSGAGAKFVFNALAIPPGEPGSMGFFFAFQILTTIVFFSSLMALFYYYGIMQRIVHAFAWIMHRTMGTSGAETLSAAGNIFLGQTEAPLLIRPYVEKMTMSELNAVMVVGFATVAGGVMAAYVGFLMNIPGIAGHLVIASIMSAPAGLALAKIVCPETEEPMTKGEVKLEIEKVDTNGIEALARGATDGLQLAFNVAAMLVAFVAVIALVDWLLGLYGRSMREWTDFILCAVAIGGAGVFGWRFNRSRPSVQSAVVLMTVVMIAIPALFMVSNGISVRELNLARILGIVFWPFAYMMGVPAHECLIVGRLLGEKMVLTEFIAYIHLGAVVDSGQLSARSAVIASYALCGFANFASIGIQLGGIGGIAPSRRADLAKLGFRAMICGGLAAQMTATIAGVIIGK